MPPDFPHLECLFDLACRDGVDIRQTLLRVLTDLYVQKPRHSAAEEAQYVELAQRLIEGVDPPTRAAVAARLAAYPAAPAIIFDRLATLLGYRPATPVPPLKPASEHNELLELFFKAESEERRLILGGLNEVHVSDSRPPHPRANEICRQLEAAALERNHPEFSRILERVLGIAPALAMRVIEDASGEPILIIARALDMSAPVLQRVLLFINPGIGQSVRRVYELSNLYGEISAQAAWQMIDIWKGTVAKPRPTHQSVYYDDEKTGARAATTTSRYGSARRSEPLRTRYKTIGR